MFKLITNADVKLSPLSFDGLVRPKFFWKMTYKSLDGEFMCTQYVRGLPCLLRVRLWCALRRCIKMHRKVQKFSGNQGVKY